MPKAKNIYVCQQCGAISRRWEGRCADCGEWNSLVEEQVVEEGTHARAPIKDGATPIPLTASTGVEAPRVSTGTAECDRVLGGGIVPGSLMLVGGDPGIGKSTLMLQVSRHLAAAHGKVLYVSGEESFNQTRLRARRLGALDDNLFILTETAVSAIQRQITSGDYEFVVIDSIQSVYSSQLSSAPGSVGQVRECANEFLRLAKGEGVPIFLVGHVTKNGAIAGPRLLEHLVDTVLYFEGEGRQALRILRAVKNRFGSTNEIGVFEMTEGGLQGRAQPQRPVPQRTPQRRQRLRRVSQHRRLTPAAGRSAGARMSQSPRVAPAHRDRREPQPAVPAAGCVGEARGAAFFRQGRVRQRGGRRAAG